MWLSWRIGMSPAVAREKVRVAKALAHLPTIDAALEKGQVSYSKVRAMTRVATPENEQTLLELALCSTAAELERICRMFRKVTSPAEAQEADNRRYVSCRESDDGMVVLTARLHPDEAARVMEALRVSAETGCEVDGLCALAESALRGDKPECPATEVVVRVDSDTLEGSFEDGTGVSAETARRLLCDAGVVPVLIDKQGNALDVGRKTRKISPALRRALKERDGICQFPGCTYRRDLDAHHIEHWIQGGKTRLSNLVEVCRRHHRFLHEFGYHLSRSDSGELLFFDPDGRSIPAVPIRPKVERLALPDRVDWPRWDGSHPNYELCVEVLMAASSAPG
jgi:hypothetical protein